MQVKKQQLEPDMEQQTGSKLGKAVRQGCLFNICRAHHENARLDEAQAGIKIAGRHINNLRYADDTTLMAESKEELKNLLMKVKEESEEAGLKLNIQKMIMVSGPITSWQIDEEMMEIVTDFIFLGSLISDYSHEMKRLLILGRKAMRNLYAGQEATELDKGKWSGSNLGKEYVKAVYCHPAYLTYMQSTSCEMLDWIKLKLE